MLHGVHPVDHLCDGFARWQFLHLKLHGHNFHVNITANKRNQHSPGEGIRLDEKVFLQHLAGDSQKPTQHSNLEYMTLK